MNEKIEQYIQDLANTIYAAESNYEMWLFYKDSKKHFEVNPNEYPLFFKTSIHAHFVAMIIALYRLFENRKKRDTVNFNGLIKLLKEDCSFPEKELSRFVSEIKEAKVFWKKVSILRNKLFAHKANSLNYIQIFKEANITPNQLRDLIKDSKTLLNEISSALNIDTYDNYWSVSKDAKRLLENLKRLKKKNFNH